MIRFRMQNGWFHRGRPVAALWLALASAIGLPALAPRLVPAQQNAVLSPADVLLLHGVNPKPDAILQFLQNGFSEAALLRGLPRLPKEKTQVVIFAVQELGNRRAKEAVDVLMQMCRRQFPPGARQAIRLDLEGMDALIAAERRKTLEEFLVFNSMVALGWIGDPKGAPAVEELMSQKEPTGYITQGALALAMMGKVKGLADLIDLMEKGSPAEAAGAARIFYTITGRYYSLNVNTSVAKRKAILDDARLWYLEFGSEFEVTGAEVRRRRQGDYPPNPQTPDLNSVRGLCRAATNVVSDYDQSFLARQKLATLNADAIPELETVARDVMEDNDVRREAIRYYVMRAGTDAKPLLKDLRKDKNPSIAERAAYILENLDDYVNRRVIP